MKKLIIIIILLVAVSCTNDYQEIEPEKFDKGVTVHIDSTQWTPALIRVDEAEVQVYDGKEIRELWLWNGVGCFFIGALVGTMFMLFLVSITKE